MTEADAIVLYEFLDARLFGWDIAIASNNSRGMIDHRTRQSKRSFDLTKDVILNRPGFEVMFSALLAGRDPVELWPEALQETVRFRLWHTVPREMNEPLSDYGQQSRVLDQGLEPWPDFLRQYTKTASVEDHPPFPPHSDLLEAWKRVGHGREV